MRLVESVVEELVDGVVCKVVVGDDFVFLRDGEAEAAVCVELVAQSVACFVGLLDAREGITPRPGMLVGCRDARFYADKLRVGDELLVRVRRQWIRESMASFSGEVVRGDDLLATMELSVVAGTAAGALVDSGSTDEH